MQCWEGYFFAKSFWDPRFPPRALKHFRYWLPHGTEHIPPWLSHEVGSFISWVPLPSHFSCASYFHPAKVSGAPWGRVPQLLLEQIWSQLVEGLAGSRTPVGKCTLDDWRWQILAGCCAGQQFGATSASCGVCFYAKPIGPFFGSVWKVFGDIPLVFVFNSFGFSCLFLIN